MAPVGNMAGPVWPAMWSVWCVSEVTTTDSTRTALVRWTYSRGGKMKGNESRRSWVIWGAPQGAARGGGLHAKGISRFINDAIRARLRPSREALDQAYKAAAREPWRKAEARDWSVTDVEDWPA
jgi:hypothetical protein